MTSTLPLSAHTSSPTYCAQLSLTHTNTNTHSHTYTDTQTHRYTHRNTQTATHKVTLLSWKRYTPVPSCTHMHPCRGQTFKHTRRSCVNTLTHAEHTYLTCRHHACTTTLSTLFLTHTHKYTHTHTNTHTHTHMSVHACGAKA